MTAATPTIASANDWLANALTSDLAVRCAWIGLICVVGVSVCAALLWQLGRKARAQRATARSASAVLRDESGASMIEFTLVVPILLAFALLLTQTTFVMAGNIYVHYAAFAATRAAVVYVGADMTEQGGAPANEVDLEKHEAIRRAAVVALLPAAGRSGGGGGDAGGLAGPLHQYYSQYGASSPRWVDTHADARFAYADANTEVTLRRTTVIDWDYVEFIDLPRGTGEFGPKDPITVRVEHDLALNVPIAKHVFADSGETATRVTAQYTLTNEGVPAPLPPRPDIPRATPRGAQPNNPAVNPNDPDNLLVP